MNGSQILNIPITVEAKMSGRHIQPQRIIWNNRQYRVIGLGRQWADEEGRHILVEVHDGGRMEIRLGNDSDWVLTRHWPATTAV